MAITRQKTQVFNQPVGVVRADMGGDLVARAISDAADQFSQMAYREALSNAEDTGQKTANAQSRASIATIDPQTGLPQAYTVPQGWGIVKTKAYQQAIDRRFEDSVNTELTAKGMEVAKTSGSAAQYKQRMSVYVQEMSKHGKDKASGDLNQYGRLVLESGSDYVTKTYQDLAAKEAKAAAERLRRQTELNSWNRMKGYHSLAVSGASADSIYNPKNGETFGQRLEKEREAALTEYNADLISFSGFTSRLEDLDGIYALSANRDLIKIFNNLDDAGKALLIQGILNPSLIPSIEKKFKDVQTVFGSNITNLANLVGDALITSSPSTLIAGFEAYAKAQGDFESSLEESFLSEQLPTIDQNTSLSNLDAIMLKAPDGADKAALLGELTYKWAEFNLNLSANDADKISSLISELESPVPNYDNIEQYLPEAKRDDVTNQISAMGLEKRQALAKSLNDRRAALNQKNDSALRNINTGIRRQIRSMDLSVDGKYEWLTNVIGRSALEGSAKDALFSAAQDKYVSDSLNESKKLPVGTTEGIDRVRAALDGTISRDELLTDAEKSSFDLLKEPYSFQRSKVGAELDAREQSISNMHNQTIKAHQIDAIKGSINSGAAISQDDLAILDTFKFKDQVVTIQDLSKDIDVMSAASKGIAYPTLIKKLENAMLSRNEDDLITAIQIFEQFSNIQTTSRDGQTNVLDTFRNQLKPETYSLLSAVGFIARRDLTEPLNVMREFQNYDGNLDADIRSDLGKDANTQMNNILAEYPMSKDYRSEILALIRVNKVRGQKITEESIGSLIESYTNNMGKDSKVIGPYIGDSTVYARSTYLKDTDIVRNQNELMDLIQTDPKFNDIMSGGTFTDAAWQTFLRGTGVYAIDGFIALMGGLDALEKTNQVGRIASFEKALNVSLKYKPIIGSFNNGQPAWEVGYTTKTGYFEPIIINGQPWQLTQDNSSVFSGNPARLAAKNMFDAAVRANAPKENIAILEIGSLATLDHIETIQDLKKWSGYDDANKLLHRKFGKSAEQYFKEARDKYMAVGE